MASALWQFWIVSLLAAVLTAGDSLSNALTTDLTPKHLMGRALGFTNSARWMGAVVGLALAGYAIETLGVQAAFLLVLVLIPIALFLVTQIDQDDGTAAQEGGFAAEPDRADSD